MDLVSAFAAHLEALDLAPGPVLVAVSGGSDSVALLDLMATTAERHGHPVVVAHADHGLHPESGQVADMVGALAARYQLPFRVGRLTLPAGASETAARDARYRWLGGARRAAEARYVCTAHQADDQAETVLMRVLRGSGPAGLAGMASRRGWVVRPLLPFRRAVLAAHVASRGLPVWSDPANSDARHLRSWLRSGVLPALEQRLPDLVPRLQQLAAQAGADRAAWDRALDLLPALEPRAEPGGISVAAPGLGGYDSPLAERVVSALGRRAGLVIGSARGARVVRLAREGRSGSMVELGAGWRAELSFGRLAIAPGAPKPAAPLPLTGRAGRAGWGGWLVEWSTEPAPHRQERHAMRAWLPGGALQVRGARSGERVAPLGGRGSRLLVRCFQEAQVPRSRRPGWPVIAVEGIAAWVPGVCRAEQFLPAPGSEAVRVDVTRG